MKEYAAGIQSSQLRLVDEAPAKSDDAGAPGEPPSSLEVASSVTLEPRNGSAETTPAIAPYKPAAPAESEPESASAGIEEQPGVHALDKFLNAATKEFEAGIVDQPLWKHAVAQSGDDRSLATRKYLRARATALRVEKREKREERRERRERALNGLGAPTEPGRPTAPAAPGPSAPRRRGAAPTRVRVIAVGVALAVLFAIALLLVVRSGSDAVQRSASVASTAAPASEEAKPAEPPVAPTAAADVREVDDKHVDWPAKLEKLKGDGNWNVVVLYAVEWTRAQPDNVFAWTELTAGYVKLRQYRDARDAATRAAHLAPDDAAAWARLGQINVALRQPIDALAAFEHAVARDDHDAASIVQVGTLTAQLGRFADARAAFAKALAIDPVNVEALCGAASLAQKEQRPKDAEAFMRQVAAQEARCRDPAEGESVRVAVREKASPASAR